MLSQALKLSLLLFFLGLALSHSVRAEDASLIAVAADSNEQKAAVSVRIMDAAYFLIYSNQGKFHRSLPNPKGSPAVIAAKLVELGVSVTVAQSFAQASLDALTGKDIIPIRRKGDVESAVVSLLECEPDSPAAKAK